MKRDAQTSLSLTVLIAAGGTGGHVFPGLAVAQSLKARGARVVWLGNPLGMEAALVPKQGFVIEWINFSGVRGKGLRAVLLLPFNLLRACRQSARALARIRPDVVLGMGGYISVPVGLMALARRCPLVVHEQNAIAGLANRLLAKVARRALVAFPDALPRAQWTGNPVRDVFAHLPTPEVRYAQRSGPLRILVVGGSLGAAALNEIVPQALALLARDALPSVVHQSGIQHLESLRAHYAAAGLLFDAKAFSNRVATRSRREDSMGIDAGGAGLHREAMEATPQRDQTASGGRRGGSAIGKGYVA